MDKVYPIIYDQQNYSDFLGTSKTATIASDGCFCSTLATKAGYYGHTISPSELNKLFISFNGKPIYVNSDLLPDNALSQVFSDIHYVKTLDYEPIPTDLTAIQTLLADPTTTLTIRINRGNGNLHFVEAVACDGYTLHIANPWSGRVEDFRQDYGDPVVANLHVIVYTGTPNTVVTATPSSAPSPLATTFNNAITKSGNFDTVADFLGITADQRVTTTAGSIVVEKFKQLQSDLANAQAELKKLQDNPVISVTTPTPAITVPSSAPVFADGTAAVASTPTSQVLTKRPVTPSAQSSSLLGRIWETLVFWLG